MSMAFPATNAVRLGADGRIAVDFGCPGCGYNLRAQQLGRDCPECGRNIDATPNDDALRRADAGYIRRVQRGAALLRLGVLLAWPFWYPGLVVATVGVWQLTAAETGRRERRSPRIGRNFARWFTAVGTPASLGAAGLAVWQFVQHSGMGGRWKLIDGMLVGTHALTFIGLMFAWRHLYDLAARADAPDAAVTLRRLWKRYFHVMLLIGTVALAVNAYEQIGLGRYIGQDLWLGPAAALLLAAALTWLWYATFQTTQRLVQILRAVAPEVETTH